MNNEKGVAEMNEYKNKAFRNSYVINRSEFDEVMLTDPMTDYINNSKQRYIDERERMIKEVATQGYEYLLLKNNTVTEDGTTTIRTKYQGMNNLSGVAIKVFENQGFQVYELGKVKEYLKDQEILNE